MQDPLTVPVRISLINEAFNNACPKWKEKLANEFPDLNLSDGFKRGDIVKSKTTDLVVLVTKNQIYDTFSGVVLIPDTKFSVGHVSSSWTAAQGEIYDGQPINVGKILQIS